MPLVVDDEPLLPRSCYTLQLARATVYAEVAARTNQRPLGACPIAVTCAADDGEVVEMVLRSDDLSAVVVEDPTTMCEVSVASLVEAQFTAGGPWVAAAGDWGSVKAERELGFRIFAKQASALPPQSLTSFRAMLQAGPTNRVYALGKLRTLRMAKEEEERWTTTRPNADGPQNVPRPAYALRRWDAVRTPCSGGTLPSIRSSEVRRGQPPPSTSGTARWCGGSSSRRERLDAEWVDGMVTSTLPPRVLPSDAPGAFHRIVPTEPGTFTNRWTRLCVSVTRETRPEVELAPDGMPLAAAT